MARKSTINEFYDLGALQAQHQTAIKFVDEFINKVNQVKPIAAGLEGTDKTGPMLKGIQELTKAQEGYTTAANRATKAAEAEAIIRAANAKAALDEAKATALANKEKEREEKQRLANGRAMAREEAARAKEEKQILAALNDYNALSKAYQDAALKAKTYFLTLGENHPITVQAVADAKAMDDILKKVDASVGQHQRNVGNYSGAVKTLEKALGDVRGKMDGYAKAGQNSADVIEQLRREEELLTKLVAAQVNGFASAAQEIRNNEQALQALGAAGMKQTEFYQELLRETAELKDNVGDLKEEIKNLASDTTTLDGLIQGAETLAGAYGIAQGTAALFGEENEELQQTLVKLQAVMVILNGLQAIRNAMQSQSSLMLLLEKGRTLALAAAQRVLTFATAGATAGVRALNGVLLAGGFTAILLLLPLVANAMASFGDETEDTTDKLKDQQKALEDLNQEYLKSADISEARRNATKGGLNDMRRELELMDAAGGSEKKRFELRQRILEKELDNLKIRRETINNDGKTEIELNEQIANKQNEITANRVAFEKKANDDATKNAKDAAAKRADLAEKSAEERKRIAEAERRAAFELGRLFLQDEADLQKALAGANVSGDGSARQKQFEAEKALIISQRDFELEDAKLTATQRELINETAARNIRAAEAQLFTDLIAIRQNFAAQEKQIAADTTAEFEAQQDAKKQKLVDEATGGFELSMREAERASNARLTALNNEYSAGKITKREYEEEKTKIEADALKKRLVAELNFYEYLVTLYEFDAAAQEKYLTKIAEIRAQISAAGVAETDTAKSKAKELKDAMIALGSELKGLTFDLFTGSIERQKNAIQDQIDMLEKAKQKDIEFENSRTQSVQERAANIAIIEARAQAEKEQLQQRQRRLDQEKARFERAEAITNIIQQTAVAVMEAAPNLFLQGLVAALGAAQIARVLSQPIPRYAEGTLDHPGGKAIVGDGGKRELVLTPDGRYMITAATAQTVDLPRHTMVLPDAEAALLHTTNKVQNITQRPVFQQPNHSLQKEFKQLRQTIQNKRENHFKFPSPVEHYMRSGWSWTHHRKA